MKLIKIKFNLVTGGPQNVSPHSAVKIPVTLLSAVIEQNCLVQEPRLYITSVNLGYMKCTRFFSLFNRIVYYNKVIPLCRRDKTAIFLDTFI